jgi:hypothetical protein
MMVLYSESFKLFLDLSPDRGGNLSFQKNFFQDGFGLGKIQRTFLLAGTLLSRKDFYFFQKPHNFFNSTNEFVIKRAQLFLNWSRIELVVRTFAFKTLDQRRLTRGPRALYFP